MDTTSGSQHTHRELQPSLAATLWLQIIDLHLCYYMLMYNIESDISPIRVAHSEDDQICHHRLTCTATLPHLSSGKLVCCMYAMHSLHNTYMDNSSSYIITTFGAVTLHVYTTVNS